MQRRDALRHLLAAAATPLIASCRFDSILQPEEPDFASLSSSATGAITLIGGGDVHAVDGEASRRRTAALVKTVLDANSSATAFMVGDLTHAGTAIQYQQYYHGSWGQFKDRTLFAIGNHDCHYAEPYGAAYYAYTGAPPYYAQTLGKWRVYSLNCENWDRGGVHAAEQLAWLRKDLEQYAGSHHILALSHYPLFNNVCAHHLKSMAFPLRVKPIWTVLQEFGAELVVSGHAHRWERFRRKLANGIDSSAGIRQFVVGTGGVLTRGVILPLASGCEKMVAEKGVVRFDLSGDRYSWTFTNEWGVVRDQGTQLTRKVLV